MSREATAFSLFSTLLCFALLCSMLHAVRLMQGGTYTTVGSRISKHSMTCPLPNEALRVHGQIDFEAVRPADSDFSSLPLGVAVQIYTVSVSNNGHNFGSSRTYTLCDNTCMTCGHSGVAQRVGVHLPICLLPT